MKIRRYASWRMATKRTSASRSRVVCPIPRLIVWGYFWKTCEPTSRSAQRKVACEWASTMNVPHVAHRNRCVARSAVPRGLHGVPLTPPQARLTNTCDENDVDDELGEGQLGEAFSNYWLGGRVGKASTGVSYGARMRVGPSGRWPASRR